MKTMTNAFVFRTLNLIPIFKIVLKIKGTPLDTYTYERNVLMHINLLGFLLMINPSKN